MCEKVPNIFNRTSLSSHVSHNHRSTLDINLDLRMKEQLRELPLVHDVISSSKFSN